MFGLYLHIPFCASKCWYCDFNSYAGLDQLAPRYVAALEREMAGAPATSPVTSTFLGGGTPSRLPTDLLSRLLESCRRHFECADDVEVTLEANPESSSLEGFGAARELGVNRVSIGVQSFDPGLLKALGRTHTPGQALEAFVAARAARLPQVNLDLMYGLPGQHLETWRQTLGQTLALEPDHLSLYALIVEADTPFGAAHRHGKLRLPDDDRVAEMHELASKLLDEAGYERYEISNWYHRSHGRPCRHNLAYWRNQPYLGFGAGAHSSFGGRRFWNLRSPRAYVRRLEAGLGVVDGEEVLTPETDMSDTIILALRLAEGLEFEHFSGRYGRDARELYGEAIAELSAIGVLEVDGERMRIAPSSLFVASEIMQRFLAPAEPRAA